MYYISINRIAEKDAKSMGFITNMECYYDKRYKRYEFRGNKSKHLKFLNLFKELAKIYKAEVYDWVSKAEYSENIYYKIY